MSDLPFFEAGESMPKIVVIVSSRRWSNWLWLVMLAAGIYTTLGTMSKRTIHILEWRCQRTVFLFVLWTNKIFVFRTLSKAPEERWNTQYGVFSFLMLLRSFDQGVTTRDDQRCSVQKTSLIQNYISLPFLFMSPEMRSIPHKSESTNENYVFTIRWRTHTTYSFSFWGEEEGECVSEFRLVSNR